jgi:hypothetical protein
LNQLVLVADLIGVAMAIRVWMAWVEDQGWNPLEWRGVVTHLLECGFCLTFWVSFPVMAALHTPQHAFAVGLVGYMFFRLTAEEPVRVESRPVRIQVKPLVPGVAAEDDTRFERVG